VCGVLFPHKPWLRRWFGPGRPGPRGAGPPARTCASIGPLPLATEHTSSMPSMSTRSGWASKRASTFCKWQQAEHITPACSFSRVHHQSGRQPPSRPCFCPRQVAWAHCRLQYPGVSAQKVGVRPFVGAPLATSPLERRCGRHCPILGHHQLPYPHSAVHCHLGIWIGILIGIGPRVGPVGGAFGPRAAHRCSCWQLGPIVAWRGSRLRCARCHLRAGQPSWVKATPGPGDPAHCRATRWMPQCQCFPHQKHQGRCQLSLLRTETPD
jgi:hypothetical protein